MRIEVDDLNISNVSGINFSNSPVSINDAGDDLTLSVAADQNVILKSGGTDILNAGLISGQKTINLNQSELLNFNTLFSGAAGTNKRIDSVSAGYNYDTFDLTEHSFRIRNAGDTAFVRVGTFDIGGFKAEGLPISEVSAISFTNLGNAISQTSTNMTFGVALGSIFRFNIGGFTEYTFSDNQITMNGNLIDNAGNVRSDIFTVQNSDVGGNPSITSAFPTLSASILGDWLPTADNTHDLGKTPGNRWRDLRLAGSGNIGTLNIGLGDSSIQHTMFGFMTIIDRGTPADPFAASSVNLFLDDSSGELSVRKFGGTTVSLETGAGGGSAGLTFASVVKSVSQGIISEPLFQPDSELRFNANANSTYGFTLNLLFSSPGGGFKFKWSTPTGTTMEWEIPDSFEPTTLNETQDRQQNPSTNIQLIQVTGRVITGSTAGIINLQFAQVSSDATFTTVHQGSWLRVYESGATLSIGDTVGSIHTKVTKAIDDEVPNSTVFVNDSELFFRGTANKTYHLTFMMFFNSPNAAGMKTTWSLPSGATGKRIPDDFSWFFGQFGSTATDITTQDNHNTNGQDQHLQFHATITMGGTDGTVNFQFAQDFADASPAKMLKGTTLLVYEEGTSTSASIADIGVTTFVEANFESRAQIQATNFTNANPKFFKKWQIIRPSGLTEFNRTQVKLTLTAFVRRSAGTSAVELAVSESTDNITYDFLDFVASNSATFERLDIINRNTVLTEDIQFIAVTMFDDNGDSTIQAREIKVTMQLNMPAGYSLVEI